MRGTMTRQSAKIAFSQRKNLRVLNLLVSLVLLAQAGCYSFGAYSMPHDIAQYNQQYVDAENRMLLYNIGLLRYEQPPQFMMLSSISQSRAFTTGGSFQW